jgi:hypothetical protein
VLNPQRGLKRIAQSPIVQSLIVQSLIVQSLIVQSPLRVRKQTARHREQRAIL